MALMPIVTNMGQLAFHVILNNCGIDLYPDVTLENITELLPTDMAKTMIKLEKHHTKHIVQLSRT